MSGERILTIGEAARFLGVHPVTLRRYDKRGVLKPWLRRPSGARIYAMSQIQEFVDKMKSDGKK